MKTLVEINHLNLLYPFREERGKGLVQALSENLKNRWHNIQKPTHRALQDVHFNIKAGERVGIIGSNGSGKSTLLKVIAGILKPTSGFVQTFGRALPLLDINGGFFPELTGRENLILMGLLLGESRYEMEARVHELIDLAGLKHFAATPIRDYSSGMVARLGFALVCSLEADILILDEVLSTTDTGFMILAEKKFDAMIDHAGCSVIVSHDLNFIGRSCSRVIWLQHGQVKADGKPVEICQEYIRWSLQSSNVVPRNAEPLDNLSL